MLGERGATIAEALPTLTGEDLAAEVTFSDRLLPANLVAEAIVRRTEPLHERHVGCQRRRGGLRSTPQPDSAGPSRWATICG